LLPERNTSSYYVSDQERESSPSGKRKEGKKLGPTVLNPEREDS